MKNLILVTIILAGCLNAQPVIGNGGVVNAASFLPGIGQGAIFNIFGSALGPADLVKANAFPLPTTLSGTTVSVSIGPNSRPVPLNLHFGRTDRSCLALRHTCRVEYRQGHV